MRLPTKKISLFLLSILLLVATPRPAFALKRLVEVLATGVNDDCGAPLVNGTATFYDAGTTTLRTVYSDFALTTPVSNPLTLDSAGRAVVYSDRRIKITLKDYTGATLRTLDNVGTADSDVIDASVTATAFPAGVIVPYGGASAPSGWLLCDGSTFVIASYPALYAVIGTSFNTGSEPAGSARLPNPARRTLVGAGGTGTGVLGNTIGSRGGEESHTLVTSEMPAHSHTNPAHTHTDSGHTHSYPGAGTAGLGPGSNNMSYPTNSAPLTTGSGTANISSNSITINSTGGDGAHNNM